MMKSVTKSISCQKGLMISCPFSRRAHFIFKIHHLGRLEPAHVVWETCWLIIHICWRQLVSSPSLTRTPAHSYQLYLSRQAVVCV